MWLNVVLSLVFYINWIYKAGLPAVYEDPKIAKWNHQYKNDRVGKVRELDKGKNRPINSLSDRMEMLNSLIYIDKVIPFRSATELERLVKWIHPSVMVIGSDWKDKEVIGKKFRR